MATPNRPTRPTTTSRRPTSYPNLPDPLVLKNGKRVTSAKVWWTKRRPEIVEDFDREIYGRVPKPTPKVTWEVVSTTQEKNGDVPVVTKKLVGHVDNSAYPGDQGGYRPDADDAGQRHGAGSGDHGVRLSREFMAQMAKRIPQFARPSRGGTDLAAAGAGQGVGLCRSDSHQLQADNGAG
jgi:hypothetical protein